MYRSSRLARFLVLAALLPTTAAAQAPHVTVGAARGLSPIRPMVGLQRGLSPIKPFVGAARQEPMNGGAHGRRRFALGWFESTPYGGIAGVGSYGPVPTGAVVPSRDDLDAAPMVIPAPPPPCVAPQIITIGRSVHLERPKAKTADVRVVYGRPPCGFR